MIAFWLASVAMLAVALAFVIPPLLRSKSGHGPSRQQANVRIYRERVRELELQEASGTLDSVQSSLARDDLDRELLAQTTEPLTDGHDVQQPGTPHPLRAIVIAVSLPVFAVSIYLLVGSPRALFDEPASPPGAGVTAADDAAQPSVEQMVARLEQRLQAQPDDVRGWLMLGRSYSIMNRDEDARAALANALERAPDDPEVMVSYAEVLTTLNQGSLEGEPIELVNRVLAIEPDSPRALWLAGIHALNEGIPSRALLSWQKILASGKLNASASEQVVQAINSVRSANATAPADATASANTHVPATNQQSADVAAGKAAVHINVSISAQLRAGITGTETLFVFARASQGPPMPVAVQRLTANQLPITVVLDDSHSMAPELAISRFDTVIVTARISRAGTPRAAPGDLQGVSAEVATRNGGPVNLLIDQRIE